MSDELDIMSRLDSVDLSKVETSFPILAAGVVQAQLVSIQPVAGDGDKKPFIEVKYTLAAPWHTQPGESESRPVNPGFPLSERVYTNDWTDPKTGETKNFGRVRLLQLAEAIRGRKATADEKLSSIFPQLIGQQVTLRLKYDPAPRNDKTGQVYGPQTTVDGYVRAKK